MMTHPIPRLAIKSLTSAQVYTSPHASPDLDPALAIVAAIKKAKVSVVFAIYSLTHPDIAAAIVAAHTKGLKVYGAGDANEWSGVNELFTTLLAAGVDVLAVGSEWNLMHLKLFVVDGKTVGEGSFNWTTQAEKSNFEILVVGNNVSLAGVATVLIDQARAKGKLPATKTT